MWTLGSDPPPAEGPSFFSANGESVWVVVKQAEMAGFLLVHSFAYRVNRTAPPAPPL